MSRAGMEARWRKRDREVGTTHRRCTWCGKIEYTTRSAAKKTAKKFPGHKYSVYRCPHGTGMFHLGHQSRWITQGLDSRLERYG